MYPVQPAKLSTTIDGFQEGTIPKDAQVYIDLVTNTLIEKRELESRTKHFKFLRYASLAVLTGALILPIGLPVMAATALFGSIILIGSIAKTILITKKIENLEIKFSEELIKFEKEIFVKLILELPEMFKDKYTVQTEIVTTWKRPIGSITHQSVQEPRKKMLLKPNAKIGDIQFALFNWRGTFRSIHSYSYLRSKLSSILNTPTTDFLDFQFALSDKEMGLGYLFTSLNKFMEMGNQNPDVTEIIDNINTLIVFYNDLQTKYTEPMKSLGMKSEIPLLQTDV